MINFFIKMGSIISLLVFILSLVFFDYFANFIISYIENNFSSDNHIEPINKFAIKLYLILCMIILLLFSILSIKKVRLKIFNNLNKLIEIDKIKLFLLSDNYTIKPHSFFSFTFSSILSLSLALYFLVLEAPTPEGLMENFMATLFLISAGIFLSSIVILFFRKETTLKNKSNIFTLLFLFIFMLFIFLEEFSWGQALFNWNINETFLNYNAQKEMTFHNFFNALFPIIYPFFALLILIFSLSVWFFSTPKKSIFRGIFEPHPSLFLLILIMTGFSFRLNTEYFEELFAIFTIFYSLRIFLCISYPRNYPGIDIER